MLATATVVGHRYVRIGEKVHEERDALELYRRLRGRAVWRRLWSVLTGRTWRLLSLASVEATCCVIGHRGSETRSVPLSQIRGSGSSARRSDFDGGFCPLHSRHQARWLGLAAARLRGVKLPPVELIEVAGVHFVVDGHHRISVARALGEAEIRARVTTWQISGTLPWEKSQDRRGRSRCSSGIRSVMLAR